MASRKKPVGGRRKKYLSQSRLAAQQKREARWHRIREVLGIALVALTAAAIIGLISHHPQDSSLNAAASDSHYRNYLGWFGAVLSDLLVQLFGFGAYFFPAVTFLLALGCFVRLAGSRFSAAIRIAGACLFVLSLLALGNMFFGSRDPLFESARAGGLAGEFLTSRSVDFLGRAGTWIVYLFTLVCAVLIMTGITVRQAAGAVREGALLLWEKARQRRQLAQGRAEKSQHRRREKPPAGRGEIPEAGAVEPEIVAHLPAPPPRKGREAKQEALDFKKGSGRFVLPPLSLLEEPPESRTVLSREELIANSRILERKLQDFGVSGKVSKVNPGPVITMYEFEPAPGVKVNRIVNLADDLALAMSAHAVRVVAPLPGKPAVGIEIPNHHRETVHLKDIMRSEEFRSNKSKLAVALGKDIFGNPRVSDLARMPHVLIAGATGAGKSVMINSMICSILFNAAPSEVQLLMIDPKMVELTNYDGIPHLIAPVVSNPKKAAYALRNAVGIMEERYRLLAERKVRNIESYNSSLRRDARSEGNGDSPSALMPYLIIVIDELADLMILAQNEVEDSITRLAQLSRAVGIHLMIATQRPSTNVITGIIKANLPVRISFQVSSKIDSRVILDSNGAEQLLGKGDMLFLPPGKNKLERVHGAYITENDVNRLVDHLKGQASPHYDESILKAPPTEEPQESEGEDDEMYDQAVEVVTRNGQASISFLQRKLRVGYNRAARMIEAMERAGILAPADGAKPRKILVRRGYDD